MCHTCCLGFVLHLQISFFLQIRLLLRFTSNEREKGFVVCPVACKNWSVCCRVASDFSTRFYQQQTQVLCGCREIKSLKLERALFRSTQLERIDLSPEKGKPRQAE
jgi:hypothetical protein